MASWQLGKIFAVDETKEADAANYVSGSESGDSDDEEALDREAAFNKHKRVSSDAKAACPVTGSSRSIRRYDEYGSFITRSERARKEKAELLPTSAMKDDKANKERIFKGKGKVSFRGGFFSLGEAIQDVKEIPEWTSDDKERLFMTRANWEAIDTDIDVTEMRWRNHIEGKIKFDEDNNTVRGIEDIIFHINKGFPIRTHRKMVLEEVNRQKIDKEYPNWEKLADVSITYTKEQIEKAQQLAKEDEKERKRIWTQMASTQSSNVSSTSNNSSGGVAASPKTPDKKKKAGLFGLFKKKSSK